LTDKDADEYLERLKRIERKVNKLRRESSAGLEDQLFFGVIISLVIFAVTLSISDIASFFQSFIILSNTQAETFSQTVKYTAILCLILSGLFRYYGAVRPHKGARLWSLLSLIFWTDLFLLILFTYLANDFPKEIRILPLSVFLFALFCIYLLLGGLFEGKMVKFYAKKGLAPDRFRKPKIYTSFLFAALVSSLYCAMTTQIIAAFQLGLFFDYGSFAIIWLLWWILFAFLFFLYVRRGERKQVA
jgi:hypothetical protein